ncbi:MAG TPA: RagB/SusD family nutrient uptake outer membrane protein [Chitinophaga sp.]|uniref:RagB/SusD family nutrient uptake outer membrane protein n=1 Tax=Chitinophaga sp. TaxID=1869181 RepID=UPI002C132A8F|nr:RagB/SusD family nutrient uptake outer membrane protein [Chitinophaga sp.]HVI46363.1 RagB/SusD family nutrient uptake outer membrane protein [Chitinophaga sp.]
MKRKIYTLVLAGFMISAASCQKDFLDKKPLDTYSDDDVWNDISLVETFVNSKYQILPHCIDPTSVASATGYSAVADEGYSKFNYESESIINLGLLSPDNLSLDNWSPDYSYIRSCNQFLSKIDGVKGDAARKARMTGEIKFIRAWSYFDLISRYGGVPIITKIYGLTDTDFLVKRNTYDECVAFILKDLDDAIAALPVKHDGNNIGRVTKGAAMALKSRLLLYAASKLNNPNNETARWQQAADAAKAVIDLAAQGAYTLDQRADYSKIFLDKNSPEVIMSYGMDGAFYNAVLGDYGSKLDQYIWPNGSHGWSVYEPSQNLVDAFEMSNGKMITEAGSGYNPASPYQGRDPRFYANILYNGAMFKGRKLEYFYGGMDSPQSPVENWNASLTGYNWRKYTDESLDLNAHGSNQAWIIFRLAEIYLNYAEAAYHLGDEGTARTWLNLVRARASVNLPAVTEGGTALMDKIAHERMIEFCFEGMRFADVRRWKIAGQTDNKPLMAVKSVKNADGTFSYTYYILQQRKFEESKHYLMPIPRYEMNKNKLLMQNPGY